MSYRTFNIIVKLENDKKEIVDYLSNNFQFFNIREFFEPFNGIVCQANEKWKDYPFEKFPNHHFKDQNEVANHFDYDIEGKVKELSIKFPEKKIAFIDVDCFGGRCTSDGYIFKNEEKILEQEPHHSGHKIILQKIYSNFNSWFFYPFTRTFFTDYGGINGDVINFSFAPICMYVIKEYGDNKEYTLQATANEMLLDCPEKFNLYFMKINDNWIKITGSILINDNELFQKVKNIIEDIFTGLEYCVQIDNLENGKSFELSTINEDNAKMIKSTSYRSIAFNSQTIDLSEKQSSSNESNKQIIDLSNSDYLKTVKSKNETEVVKKSLFKRLFGK